MSDLRSIGPEKGAVHPSQITRVLVVDDDELDFFSVKRFLDKATESHYQLTYAASHVDALTQLQSNRFDVVLLDYYLPGGTPDEIYGALNGGWNIPIIVLTGTESDTLEDMVLEAGAFYFLNKSDLCSETLVLSIDSAIRRFALDKKEREQRETLRRNWKNAEAANFSKSEFLSFLGDEIKTPLNAILGFSKALEKISVDDDLPPKFQMYSSMINDSSSHLMDLIDDLLELSQTQTSEFDPRGERFKRYRTWILDKQNARPADDSVYEQAMLAKQA